MAAADGDDDMADGTDGADAAADGADAGAEDKDFSEMCDRDRAMPDGATLYDDADDDVDDGVQRMAGEVEGEEADGDERFNEVGERIEPSTCAPTARTATSTRTATSCGAATTRSPTRGCSS